MTIANPHTTSRIFVLFAILAVLIRAYEIDDPSCEEDKCFVEIHSDTPLCWMQGDNQYIQYLNPMDGGTHRIPNACTRSNLFGGDGYLVAYPSAGGVVLLQEPLAVDLQYLGLPNTHDTVRVPDEDDELATRMVQLGAQWWPNWNLYFRHSSRIRSGIFYDYHFPSKVDVAFPTTGGAWVSNFTQDAGRHQYGDLVSQPWLPHAPDWWYIKMRYALSMDDKAEMMKDMGATFYASIDEVSGLAKTVPEAISLFEPFRERLSNMDDNVYRNRWCAHDGEEDRSSSSEQLEKSRWGIWSLLNELR